MRAEVEMVLLRTLHELKAVALANPYISDEAADVARVVCALMSDDDPFEDLPDMEERE